MIDAIFLNMECKSVLERICFLLSKIEDDHVIVFELGFLILLYYKILLDRFMVFMNEL